MFPSLICSSLGNMTEKMMFPGLSTFWKKWPENSISGFVYLHHMTGNNVPGLSILGKHGSEQCFLVCFQPSGNIVRKHS